MKNQKGFTLIEIIAVLVILGILAAVAIPKYIDLATQAKVSAAQGEIAELKSTLNLAYYQLFLTNGTAPSTSAAVVTAAAFGTTVGTAPDVWTINVSAAGSNAATVSVTARGTDNGYAAAGTWNLP